MTKTTDIKSIEQLGNFNDEYVYDVGINNTTPYFFANNILVHNSCYFTVMNSLKHPYFKEQYPNFIPTKDSIVELYDNLSDEMNDTFPEFMDKAFNTGLKNGGIIKAGRELVGSTALFIKKKKYAIMVYDKEGSRLDKDGKEGKPKVMGLDLKRSDTPKYMQDFMYSLLIELLTTDDMEQAKTSIFDQIKVFRKEFRELRPLEMGSPKRVNGITTYVEKLAVEQSAKVAFSTLNTIDKKVRIPGHVRAGMNWNILRNIHNDMHMPLVVDGQKCVVCKLKPNEYSIDSIAYPVDVVTKPSWLLSLPYDKFEMEEIIIDKKLENLFGILGWNTKNADYDIEDDFFSFE
jgi:hypothetical protein